MAHNGGKVQTNLNHPGTGSGDFPFKNCALNSTFWDTVNGGIIDYSKHDDDGWMHTVYQGGVKKFYDIPSQTERPGNYVVAWDGGGTVNSQRVGGSAYDIVSGSATGTAGGTRRYVFSTDATNMEMNITAVGSAGTDYPHNIRVCHVDDETALEAAIAAGRPWDFGVKFLSRMEELKPYAIRFLNSVQNNQALISVSANRKPTSFHSYPGAYPKKSLIVGPTTRSGNAYTLAFSGFTKVHRAVALFYYDSAATFGDPITLDIEGTGATTLVDPYINAENGDEIQYEIRMPITTHLGGVMYDSLLDKYIMLGGSGELLTAGVDKGWPIEVMMDLCRIVRCHFDCPLPKFAIDPPTDLVLTYCQLADSYLTPYGLKLMFAGPNENWNSANGFTNDWYARHREEARAVGASPAYASPTPQEWYGRIMAQVGPIVWDYFNDDTSKFDLIGEGQTFGTPSAFDACMASTRYVAENGDDTDLAASNYITEWRIAGYYNVSQFNSATETAAAASYAAAADADEELEIVDTYMSDESGSSPFKLSGIFARYALWRTWLDDFPGVAFGQYEAGFSPDYGGDAEINTFRAAQKNWPGLYNLAMKNYLTFELTYGGRYSAMYRLSGKNSAWNVLDENIHVTPDPPQWTAACHYSNKKQRMGLELVH